MALNDAQSRATCLMMYFWCVWLALIAVVTALAAPGVAPYAAAVALIVGTVAAVLHAHRRNRKIPSFRHPASSRAPRTVRGAWAGIALVAVGSCGLMVALGLFGESNLTPGSIAGAAIGAFFLIGFFAGTLLIPAWHIENATRLFRVRIDRDPELKQTLEGMSVTYQDPNGRLQFGPL